jgi:hypothetical protein
MVFGELYHCHYGKGTVSVKLKFSDTNFTFYQFLCNKSHILLWLNSYYNADDPIQGAFSMEHMKVMYAREGQLLNICLEYITLTNFDIIRGEGIEMYA